MILAKKKNIAVEEIIEDIVATDYCDEMSSSFIDYAVSVITDRALPDVRDGLKPVHRRILWAMKNLGMSSTGDYKKAARVVGETMGKYHPHGDSSIYDAIVHMAQDWCYTHPLVDGHGNFGSVEGDDAAASRYTEARLSEITEDILLADLDKGVVDFIPNFDAVFFFCVFKNLTTFLEAEIGFFKHSFYCQVIVLYFFAKKSSAIF